MTGVGDDSRVSNPWGRLPLQPDYVLPEDAPQVYEHNLRVGDHHRLRLHVLPEPFMGPVDAPVVLLNLNPGFIEADVDDYAPESRAAMMRESLTHGLSRDEAFYFLTDEFEGTGGGNWWRKRLAPVIRRVGIERVRCGVQVLEYLPYKSRGYRDVGGLLPSQRYTFQLARDAVERGALVVVMRKYNDWTRVVPELAAADLHRLRSWQNVTIGPGNCPTGFEDIVRRLS